jgi:hypothetical protein
MQNYEFEKHIINERIVLATLTPRVLLTGKQRRNIQVSCTKELYLEPSL